MQQLQRGVLVRAADTDFMPSVLLPCLSSFRCHWSFQLSQWTVFWFFLLLIKKIYILIVNTNSEGFLPCSDLNRAARKAEIKIPPCSNSWSLTAQLGELHQSRERTKAVWAEVCSAPRALPEPPQLLPLSCTPPEGGTGAPCNTWNCGKVRKIKHGPFWREMIYDRLNSGVV